MKMFCTHRKQATINKQYRAVCGDTILMYIDCIVAGHIVGFDEYMNLVLDDAEEVHLKSKNRKTLGRIMLKGDNITLIQNVNP